MARSKRGDAEPTHFARTLTRLRRERGLSLYRLAQRAGLSDQAVSDIEAGRRRDPQFTTVQKLALALGVDVAVFCDPGLELPEGS